MKALIKWKYGKWIAYSLPILWLPAIVLAFFATRTRDSWQNFYADTVHETVFQYYFAFNYISSIIWLRGVKTKNVALIKGALILWGLYIVLCVVAIILFIFVGDKYKVDKPDRRLFLSAAFVYMLFNFAVALMCFESRQEDERKKAEVEAENQKAEVNV